MVSEVCFCEQLRECLCNLQIVFTSFTDTKHCSSILPPIEYTLRKTLQFSFVNAKSEMDLREKNSIDLCCRSLHKCDTHNRGLLNPINEWRLWHCECVKLFHKCLNNVNTTLSNGIAFIHSLNTTKCYKKDRPIVKCLKFENYSNAVAQLIKFSHSDEREKYLKRCKVYHVDLNQREKLQQFDVSLVVIANTSRSSKLLQINQKYLPIFI